MRISFPASVPMSWVTSFTAVLFAIQLLEGTDLTMAVTAGGFIMVAGLAFNLAGGLKYPSGGFIFFNVLLTCIFGMVAKAALGEPLQANLLAPRVTMMAYFLGICAIALAAYVNRFVRRTPGFLTKFRFSDSIAQVGVGCLAISILTPYVIPNSVMGTFSQFNVAFFYITILLPVYDRAKRTGGRKTFNAIAAIAWGYATLGGMLSFSKQGIFQPAVCWLIAAAAAGVLVSKKKLLILAVLGGLAATFLTPYAQIGREYRGDPQVWDKAMYLLEHPQQTREIYALRTAEPIRLRVEYRWFDKPEGLLDRLNMIAIDDGLIYWTDHGRPEDLTPIYTYFLNVIPRYLTGDKPLYRWGNYYAHQIGLLSPKDNVTGVSFSCYAEAYHVARWYGSTLLMFGCFMLLFFTVDSVAGRLGDTNWALLYIVYFSHAAPEGMLGLATIYSSTTLTVAVIGCAIISTRIAPVIGSFLVPSTRQRVPTT